jgi:hypothetical protein
MKKSILTISLVAVLVTSGISYVSAQEQPKPKKDTVNMDTDAKPQFYYAVEDEKTGAKESKKGFPVIPVVAGVVVIGAAVAFFLMKKKK